MANVLIEEKTMTDIANAIRTKSGTVEKMKPAEMPKTILEMEVVDTGVGSRQWWQTVYDKRYRYDYAFYRFSTRTIPVIDTGYGLYNDCMFGYSEDIITIPPLNFSRAIRLSQAFIGCVNLKTFQGELNIPNAKYLDKMFYNCISLTDITFTPNCIKVSLSFQDSDKLTDESIQSIIDGLADLTGQTAQTITFHSTVKNKLTEEQIASATSKNWNIA